ncbi:MAG TPA: hypothetical protein VJN21_11315 [Candidatus Acidoferrales bacterium]|nr:hypothetical protein [Candidatus Acidoferrales bacterium]
MSLFLLLIVHLFGYAFAAPSLPAAGAGYLVNSAKFSVDSTKVSPPNAVATIEPRLGAPGYSWLRIWFYSSPLKPADLASLIHGDTNVMNKTPLNQWQAALQLSVDKDFKVWQVDMAIPGHTCTIMESDQDFQKLVQAYQYVNKHLTLKSKGAHVCDFSLIKIPNQTFTWDVDLSMPVFSESASKRN